MDSVQTEVTETVFHSTEKTKDGSKEISAKIRESKEVEISTSPIIIEDGSGNLEMFQFPTTKIEKSSTEIEYEDEGGTTKVLNKDIKITRTKSQNAENLLEVKKRTDSVFRKYDKNQDDVLDSKEIQVFLEESSDQHFSRKLSAAIIAKGDMDNDGTLNRQEFQNLVLTEPDFFKSVMKKYCMILGRDIEKLKIPFVIATLSVIQMISFVLDTNSPIKVEEMFIFRLCNSEQIWRVFTYQFLHGDITHLTMNLFIQLFLSIPLESYHEWWSVLIIYSSGVLFGALGHAFNQTTGTLVGASAGVYGLLFANIAFLLMNFKTQKKRFVLIAITVTILYILLFQIAGGDNEKVCHISHISGAVGGILIGIIICKNDKVTRCEELIRKFAIFLYVTLIFVGTIRLIDNYHVKCKENK